MDIIICPYATPRGTWLKIDLQAKSDGHYSPIAKYIFLITKKFPFNE